jgi:acetoin utilization protein AcuB
MPGPIFKDEFSEGLPQICPGSDDKENMNVVAEIMTREVACVDMDRTLGEAMALCSENHIRHLPVLDEHKRLVGLVTDRDLRYFLSPRIGTLSENSSDRESMGRPVHLVMVRGVHVTYPNSSLAEVAQIMLDHRIGCLPVIDGERHVVGIVTTNDFLRYITAKG